ncbi:MAG: AAA family ATPase [Nitrospiraceae bacterium]|nr:MAG: AAA family ATPase [Nitrospiraceae bacterium]
MELKSRELKKEFAQLLSSIHGYQIKNIDNQGHCDLLIMELGDSVNGEFDLFRSLKATGEIGEVFLTSSSTNPAILIEALRAGAKEFFTQPLNREDVMASLLKFKDQWEGAPVIPQKTKKGKIINVIGGKGGVGTTTVAVNIAASLNELENVDSVALIDMNLVLGEIPLFMDLETSFNWGEVAKNISRVDSTYLMSVLAKHPSGVFILPSPTDYNGEKFADADTIEQLLEMMMRTFDYIVIDNGQSLNDISRKILELSDTVFLVSIPTLPCLINVKRLLKTFLRLGFHQQERVKIIMNRSHRKSMISIKEAEEGIGKKISWLIPNDYNSAMSAINKGKVLTEIAKKAEITKTIQKIAVTLCKGENRSNGKKSFWGRKPVFDGSKVKKY